MAGLVIDIVLAYMFRSLVRTFHFVKSTTTFAWRSAPILVQTKANCSRAGSSMILRWIEHGAEPISQ